MSAEHRASLIALVFHVCVPPSVAQDGGVVKRPPPVAVRLVDLSAVLQEELAGCQGILVKKREHVNAIRH